MNTERLAFALERLEGGDWARFERFASQYLVFDYPTLRTVASPSGDLGRDSELFSPDGDPAVLLQYSVSKDWASKIRSTAKRVREGFAGAKVLVYVTNQRIGAQGDALKMELRKEFKLLLDVHDCNWFLDRLSTSSERAAVAKQLVADVVDPYLAGRDIVESKSPALTEIESKAAVLYLQLQWEDDSRAKGLTKVSYDGLVKSVLRQTNSSNRVKKQFVRESIRKLLPNHPQETVDFNVNAALERLDKKAIRHWRDTEEVCLTHDETIKVNDALARKELKSKSLDDEIVRILNEYFQAPVSDSNASALRIRTRRILDRFLLRKGEEFAAAVALDQCVAIKDDSLDVLVSNDFGMNQDTTDLGAEAVAAVRSTLTEVLQRSNPTVHQYLREIADGYTLFAFLRSVPDVQKAVQKIFRDGIIWLDTSVLLPVMAETLLYPDEQIVTKLLNAAGDAGIELRVTSGVIEEIERHVNRCITYVRAQTGAWVGGVPFLYAMFAFSGQTLDAFEPWVRYFCDKRQPKEDIAEYLLEEWGIKIEDLTELVDETPVELRWEVDRIWREAHEARRKNIIADYDDYVIDRLVKHDVECYLGVLAKRKGMPHTGLGYIHWWLTLDKTVRDFEEKLKESLGPTAPSAPVISPDFLADYLAVGPNRGLMSKATEATLPVAMFDMLPDHLPTELLEIADGVRKECGSIDGRLMRRKLRDVVEDLKRTKGPISKGGFAAVREKIERAFKARPTLPLVRRA